MYLKKLRKILIKKLKDKETPYSTILPVAFFKLYQPFDKIYFTNFVEKFDNSLKDNVVNIWDQYMMYYIHFIIVEAMKLAKVKKNPNIFSLKDIA